jgi:hypothetical protein|tara:strand:+ start:220 stop:531 length:312 start_codon:yes stop_codon:yes gene_type:complete
MELDLYGNPVGTKYSGEGDCPADMMCIPANEFHMQLEQAGMEYDETSREIQPVGDAEAIIDFTKDLLFLDISVIFNMAIPLTIFAVYGLTIYAAVKFIQKKLS